MKHLILIIILLLPISCGKNTNDLKKQIPAYIRVDAKLEMGDTIKSKIYYIK